MNTGLAAALAALAIGGVLAVGLSLGGSSNDSSGIPSGPIPQDVDVEVGSEVVEETAAETGAAASQDAAGAAPAQENGSGNDGRGDDDDGVEGEPEATSTGRCRVADEINGDDFDITVWTSCTVGLIDPLGVLTTHLGDG